jgi:hypothetical protein
VDVIQSALEVAVEVIEPAVDVIETGIRANVIELEPTVSEPFASSRHRTAEQHRLVLRLDGFTRKTLAEQATQMGVSAEELATFGVLYYLADLDSGRVARRVPQGRAPAAPPDATPSDATPSDASEPSRERRPD